MVKCPGCGQEVEFFDIKENVYGRMYPEGTDWFNDQSVLRAECPECDEELDWDVAVKIMREARQDDQ